MAADRLSGAAVVVMMVESFVPIGAHFKSLEFTYGKILFYLAWFPFQD